MLFVNFYYFFFYILSFSCYLIMWNIIQTVTTLSKDALSIFEGVATTASCSKQHRHATTQCWPSCFGQKRHRFDTIRSDTSAVLVEDSRICEQAEVNRLASKLPLCSLRFHFISNVVQAKWPGVGGGERREHETVKRPDSEGSRGVWGQVGR